jgi:hypothetical protein
MLGMYRGLQRKYSQLESEYGRLQNQTGQLAKLDVLAAQLDMLMAKTVGDEEAKTFRAQVENAQLKAQLAQQYAPASQPAPAPVVDERTARQQALDYWFPGAGIGLEESGIDWASDALDATEAQTRFKTSVTKLLREKAATTVRDEEARKRKAVEDKTKETLREAGIDRELPVVPTGDQALQVNALTSKEPKDWDRRALLRMGFESEKPEDLRRARLAARKES